MKRLLWLACAISLVLLMNSAEAQMDGFSRFGASQRSYQDDALRPDATVKPGAPLFPSLSGNGRDKRGDADLEALKKWQTRNGQVEPERDDLVQRPRREDVSGIEKAYRLQYSETLLDQIKSLDDFEFLDFDYDLPWPELMGGQQPDWRRDDLREGTIDRQRDRQRDVQRDENGAGRLGASREDRRDARQDDRRTTGWRDDAQGGAGLSGRQADDRFRDSRLGPDRQSARNKSVGTADADRLMGSNAESSRLDAERRGDREREAAERRKLAIAKVIDAQLTQFGYDFFERSEFLPKKSVVPDGSYLLGPGDVLRIKIWGNEVDAEFSGKIQMDGTIMLPRLGVLPLAGTPYGSVNDLLAREVKKYVQGVNVHAVLEDMRDVQVYVAGQVGAPGLKYVPSFSTVLTALAAGQGPLKSGSLRHIQIYRGGKLHRELDLYDLIAGGDARGDILLTDRDVIYVPYIGPTVAVVGAVVRPGIFELKSAEGRDASLAAALHLAGGPLGQSYGKVYLRGFQNGVPRSKDFEIKGSELSRQSVANGDLVEARYVGSRNNEDVRLLGHVWEKIDRTFQPGLTLAQVLNNPLNVKPGAVSDYGVIRRYAPITASYSTVRFPLAQVLEGKFDMPLQPRDRIFVLAKKDLGVHEEVAVTGGVWKPGSYEWEPGMTVQSLVAKSGGLRFGSLPRSVQLSRQYLENNVVQTRHVVVDMEGEQVALQPYDSIHIPYMSDAGVIRQVEITGQVRFPGTYTIRDGEHLSDLIQRAGGFLPDAYFYGAKFISPEARRLQQKSLDNLVGDLESRVAKALIDQSQTSVAEGQSAAAQLAASRSSAEQFIGKLRAVRAEGRVAILLSDLQSLKGSEYDLVLEEGDRLDVPRRPSFVSVVGSVYTPNSFNYQPNLTVADYLKRSGGPTKTADQDHMYVLKANGEVFSMAQGGFFKGSFEDVKLMPGDTLVVPEDLERVPWLRFARDVTDIVFKIATTAGIAIAVL